MADRFRRTPAAKAKLRQRCEAFGRPKQKYPDRRQALAHARGLGLRFRKVMHVFRCSSCGFWHVGSVGRSWLRKRREAE